MCKRESVPVLYWIDAQERSNSCVTALASSAKEANGHSMHVYVIQVKVLLK